MTKFKKKKNNDKIQKKKDVEIVEMPCNDCGQTNAAH